MKRLVTLLTVVAVAAVVSAPVSALACNKDKAKTTTAAAASLEKGAACSAEMIAACKAKGMSATTASAKARGAKSASSCASKASAAVAAANGACASKSAATAVVATATPTGVVDAVPVGGASCHADGKAAGKTANADCIACDDMASCEGELNSIGANMQIVALKNGVMYVYTAAGASKVHAVQTALARRGDRINAMIASGDKAALCGECKQVRGAMASGKLSREVVNIEGGCLTLMTSNDPAMIAKIHAMAGVSNASRKS